ncbi:hypothetical protein JKF63_05030 [Porcisia hertigi]|uniref:Uncharacterized protein n=1 Tax=Porcisia hertigi TaxID=2761500 RepID=A0A836IJB5_9TRYP|nr:hypothetical protein JKF63_05030 [Porcisia hertigi]
MRRSAHHLARAAGPAVAKPRGGVVFTSANSALGKQAVGELDVYLRSMKAAQRRWAREIVAHETHVRRLMIAEEQFRGRLKQQVLKGTREHLKYLTNTDLMAVAQLVSPPSVDVFLAYGIPSEQVSGFTVYVMGCLAADPNRLDVPLPILIADLSSTWFIVPPRKKEAYNELAAIFRAHLPSRPADVVDDAASATVASPTAIDAGKLRRRLKVTERSTAFSSARGHVCAPRPPPRGGRGCQPKASVAATGGTPVPRAVRSAGKRLQVGRRGTTAAAANTSNSFSSSVSEQAAVATQPSTLLPSEMSVKGLSKAATCGNHCTSHSVISSSPLQSEAPLIRMRSQPPSRAGDKAALAAFTEELQLSKAEQSAFRRFAEASLRAMEQALSVLPASPTSHHRRGSSKAKRSTKVQPRGVQLLMEEWLPIAAEEWMRKTRRQKSFFYMRG